MIFIYSVYEYILGEKEITATLKDEVDFKPYTLRIITPARRFIGMPFGGGLVKISRLYDANGNLIKTRKYSNELKDQIKDFKQECPIPYFKLWKGFVFVFVALIIGSIIYGIKNKIENGQRTEQTTLTVNQLSVIKAGDLYGVSFFTDVTGNNIDGLPEGWIRIVKIEGNSIFAQRSKETVPVKPVFDMDHIMPILPKTESDWEPTVEKFDYDLLASQIQESSGKSSFDLMYVDSEREKYNGVVLSIKGVLKQ